MKIAIFAELALGGALRVVKEHAAQLAKRHDVQVWYTAAEVDPWWQKHGLVTHWVGFHARAWVGQSWRTRLYKDTWELGQLRQTHKQIAHQIQVWQPDVVYAHPSCWTQAPWLLTHLRGKLPTVYFCQEPLRLVYDPALADLNHLPWTRQLYEMLSRKLRQLIDWRSVSAATTIVANSVYSQVWIAQAYNLAAEVCYLGVVPQVFIPGKSAKEVELLFVGNLEEVEGYPLIVQAWELLGRRPTLRVISRAQNQVITETELVQAIQTSRIVLCASVHEPFGLVVLEAMSCGVPVIAVDEGGYRESVEANQTGVLVSRDSQVLAATIKKLLASSKNCKKYGKTARKRVLQRWTWELSARSIEKILTRTAVNYGDYKGYRG